MLEIYVAPGCDTCAHALILAERVADEFAEARVTVVDIEDRGRLLPSEVFAVPSFVLNGAVVSLGNPTWERLRALLTQEFA